MFAPKPYTSIARLYDLLDLPFEYGRYRPLRPTLWQGLSGRILDAGVGTGRNMDFYPPNAQVTGIDLSPVMLSRAQARQRKTRARVELHEMDVCKLDIPDHRFDAVVATFLFCVLDDALQLPALRELRRVCKPEGEIRILEYAYSQNPLRRAVMKMWAPWVRFAYGATFDRNTEQYIETAGLELIEDRFLHRDIIKLLTLRPADRRGSAGNSP